MPTNKYLAPAPTEVHTTPRLGTRLIMGAARLRRSLKIPPYQWLMETNLSKTQNKVSVYNYEVLQKILSAESSKIESGETTKSSQEGESDWRNMPTCDMEMMLISSYGDEFIPLFDAVPKLQDNTVKANEKITLARKELDVILDKCRVDNGVMLKYFCTDFPGAQFPKDYYLDRVKQFFEQCDKDGGWFIA